MAAPLEVRTKGEQRAVIWVLWSECVSGAAFHQRLSAQYGNSVWQQRSVYKWIEKFKNGRTNVTHEEWAGRSSTAANDDAYLTDAYRFLGRTRPSTGTLSDEWHNNKQCMLQWDAYWQAKACNSKQTSRTTAKRCCVGARQCLSTYCFPKLLKCSGSSSLK